MESIKSVTLRNVVRLPLCIPIMGAMLGVVAAPLAAQSEGETITVPVTGPDNVFVDQIGSGNVVDIEQAGTGQTAELRQNGTDNVADLDQRDGGEHIALVTQTGDRNATTLAQEGDGQAIAVITQNGSDNAALVFQRDNGSIGTAAEIAQTGSDNTLVLSQDGSDNLARLTQNGDGNAMTATQLNNGNQLDWVQDGSGLSDLNITQTGGQEMLIVQTNSGIVTSGGSN